MNCIKERIQMVEHTKKEVLVKAIVIVLGTIAFYWTMHHG